MSLVQKTSIALIIAKFFQKGLGFITAPIFTRIMPSSEYGLISTFTSWQSIFYIIATLNMSQGVFNNGMLEFKKDRESFTYSILILANLITFLFTTIYIIGYKVLNPIIELPNILIIVMIIYFFVTPAYNYWLGKSRFEYKYKSIFILTTITTILSSVISIIFVLISPTDKKAIAKIVSMESISIIVGIVFYIYTLVKAKGKIDFKYWKYALKINLPLIPHYLSMYVLASSDRIMISKLVNTSATAIYNISYTVASIVLIFWNAMDSAYAPWIYQKMDSKDYNSLKKRGEEVLLLFAGFAICITLFSPEIIRILGPKEYYEGVYIIPSVVAGVYFTAAFSLYMRVELYLKKSATIMFATICAALTNLVLNYIFILKYGYQAAGYTTLLCYMLLAIFHAKNLKNLGYGNVYNNKNIAIISSVVCLTIVCLSILYTHVILRYLLILIILLSCIKYRDKVVYLIKKRG